MLASIALSLLAQEAAPPDPSAVSPDRLQATLRELCAQSRLAGTPESVAAADAVARAFAEAGLRVERPRYRVYLPRQTAQSLRLLGADGTWTELALAEETLAVDAETAPHAPPPMHGLTAAGTARGRVVFAGRGSEAEFARLREAGVALEGTIALVRYGGLYRGLKVKHAEEAGCAAALLYTDGDDDGEARGATMPEGPWRPRSGIQRGSVYNGDGDPLTPGWAAKPDAERIPLHEARGLVGIPSLPISMGNAARLFGSAGRPESPAALDCTVEVRVEQNTDLVDIENVVGWLDADDAAAEWVLAGAHRDAWGLGAVDNATGTSVLVETARVLGAAYRNGWRPSRSIGFAAWDAEEWGLVGSTEWVEERRAELVARGVAYLNMDSVASGPNFRASCTPGLVGALRNACSAEDVPAPERLGAPGGGSDHIPFLELAGVEVMGFGFSGGHGSYHSALDTPWLLETHLDPDYEHHARAARMLTRMLTEVAEPENRLQGVVGWAARARRGAEELAGPETTLAPLLEATAALERGAAARGEAAPHPHRFHRFFVPPARGARSILWRSEGYGGQWFPEVAAAIRDGGDADAAVTAAVRALDRATRALGQAPPEAGR